MSDYPIAARHPVQRIHHGRVFVDDYEWLRDKENPETLAYLEAENEYAAARTDHLSGLRARIFDEIKSRTKETDMSVPSRGGKWWYYTRIEEGNNYGVSCRVEAPLTGDMVTDWTPPVIEPGTPVDGEQVLLDANELAEGHEFFSLGVATSSRDGKFLAYSTDTTGDERYTLRIKNIETGELLDDVITNIAAGAMWVGTQWLFYERVDDAWRPHQIWRHKLGTSQDEDILVYEETDERFWVGINGSRSRKYLFIEIGSKVTSEIHFLDLFPGYSAAQLADLADPLTDGALPEIGESTLDRPFTCALPRQEGVLYDIDHADLGGTSAWIVTHNAHGEDFEIAVTEDTGQALPSLDELEVLIPHEAGRRLEGIDVYERHLILAYRGNAINKLAVAAISDHHDASSPLTSAIGDFQDITFDEELYSAGMGGASNWRAPMVRLGYESFTHPGAIYDYVLSTGERILRREQEVLGGYDPTEYTAYRRWVTARDGVKVPISIVHRADLDMSTGQPVLLYGYGSYEYSLDPGFSISRLSMLDRGIVYVFAHIRGGGEMGRQWYLDGKLLSKKNTFTDFIDVADYLLDTGMTDRAHLAAMGGSAGGLLMGAVANMGGDRFKAINADVPFVDALTSILMPELPLTVIEWDEWGDPLHDPDVYDYMASYSPYENIDPNQKYPALLVTTGLHDTRVLYVEPAKWVAKLRAVVPGVDVILKTEMSAGHGGVSGRYSKWEETAFDYAWIIDQIVDNEPERG